MKKIEHMTEEELNNQLKTIGEEREDFERDMKKMQEAWEEENFKAARRYQRWEEMRERFSPEDTRMRNFINAHQNLMNAMKKRQQEISENAKATYDKMQREWDMQEEDIFLQMCKLQEDRDKG